MPITSTWTDPVTLDRNIGDILTEAIWDALVSNELYLYNRVLQSAVADCSADTTISAAATWTDVTGCSLSLGAGTWHITAGIRMASASTATPSLAARIFNSTDSTTVIAGGGAAPGINLAAFYQLSYVVTLGATKTVKLQGYVSSVTGGNGTVSQLAFALGPQATTLAAVRIG